MEFGIKKILGASRDFSVSEKIWTSTVYKIVFIPEEGCRLMLLGQEFEFEANSLLFIPKAIHLIPSAYEDRSFTLIYFSEEFFSRSNQDLNFLKDCDLFSGHELLYRSIQVPNSPNSIYSFVEEHLALSKKNYGQLLYRELAFTLVKQVILLGSVYLNLFPATEQFVDQGEIRFAYKFRQMVDEYVISEKKVTFYADKLAISPRKLTLISKKVLGKTPKEIINEGVLHLSKRMLSNTKKSIKQIAWELQYADENNFSATFTRLYGESPREFRKSLMKRNVV